MAIQIKCLPARSMLMALCSLIYSARMKLKNLAPPVPEGWVESHSRIDVGPWYVGRDVNNHTERPACKDVLPMLACGIADWSNCETQPLNRCREYCIWHLQNATRLLPAVQQNMYLQAYHVWKYVGSRQSDSPLPIALFRLELVVPALTGRVSHLGFSLAPPGFYPHFTGM